MRPRSGIACAVTVLTCAAGNALSQQLIAALPFNMPITAGPTGTNYEPPDDARDLWIIEDFSVGLGVNLDRFESLGTVFPAPAFVFDVTVRIYDAMPPKGNIVLSSVPGSGTVAGDTFRALFGGQHLPPGSYFLVWNASTRTSINQRAIFWAQEGPHAVGGGIPENAWLWNPGGAWGYPNNLKPVPDNLQGTGHSGVNFRIYGTPVACYANCDNSSGQPALTANDFQCFFDRFIAGESYANCDGSTSPPLLTANDFGCFINRFASGCP